MIRVVVVDDHPAVRMSLADFFEAQDGMTVVGEGADGAEALDLSRQLEPDVVVMDVRMPVLDGIAATREIKSERPETRVVLITAYDERELVEAGVRAGADAFALKGTMGATLADRVRTVLG